jgi:hypothetical protein
MVPGPVLVMFAFLVLLTGAAGVMGWTLISDQAAQLQALSGNVERLQSELSEVPESLKATAGNVDQLGRDFQRVGDDLVSAKNEIRQRHDSLDERVRTTQDAQKKSLGDAIRQMSVSLQSDINGIKDGISDLQTNQVNPAIVDIRVVKEKLELLQDLVTSLASAPPAPAAPVLPDDAADAERISDDAPGTLEEKEINEHISKLSDSDPGKRYSAVIALGHHSGERVVKALEAMLAPDPDPEDYVRVAVIQRLRELGRPSSVPHVIGCLRDADYFVRVAARGALRSLTGTKMEFDPDGSPSEREDKVKNWERWWEENKGKLLSGASA